MVIVAVVLATTVAYAPAIRGPFFLDDAGSIPGNATITRLWPPGYALHPPPGVAVSGRPVVNYSLALNHALNDWLGVDQRPDPNGPNKTVSFHVVNLFLHLICGALLYGVLRRTLRSPRLAPTWRDSSDQLALIVCAIWLLHPIQTEAVNYLIQRTELLVSVFYVATLYFSIRAWDASPARRQYWYALAVASCLLGMGSKEVMVTAPLAVVLYDRVFHVESWAALGAVGRWRFYGALCLTTALLFVLLAGGARNHTAGFDMGMQWYRYLYSQCWAIGHYLRLMVWPNGLTLDYGSRAVTGPAGIPGLVVLCGAAVSTVFAWTHPKRWAPLGFLGAMFFLILAPSSSFVPVVTEIAAERRAYLALAPILIAMVAWLHWLIPRATASRWSYGAILLLAVPTFLRSKTYANVQTMWLDTIAKRPDNSRAYLNLGNVYLSMSPPRLDSAALMYTRAVAADSANASGWYNLAEVAMSRGRPDDAEPLLKRALVANGQHQKALERLGALLSARGDFAGAIPILERAVVSGDVQPRARVDLATAYAAAGRPADAVRTLVAILELEPGNGAALGQLGTVYTQYGRPADAIPYLEASVRLDPSNASSWATLSLAYASVGRADDAVGAATRATSPPSSARNLTVAGWAMLRAKRLPEAERFLMEAIRRSPADPDPLTALANVKAARGSVAEARALYRRALTLVPGYAPAQRGLQKLGQ